MEHYELMRQGKDRTDPSFPTRRKVNLMMADEADEADEADPVGRALSEFMNALAGQNERELELFSCYHECFFVRLPSTTAPSTQPTTQRRQPTRHLMTDPTRLGVTADTDHLSATHERKLVTALTRLGAAVVYQPIIPHFGYDDFDTNLRIWKWRHQRGLPDATESENGKMDCLNELRAFNSGWAAKKYHDQLAFTHRILGKGLSRDSACLAYLSPVVIRSQELAHNTAICRGQHTHARTSSAQNTPQRQFPALTPRSLAFSFARSSSTNHTDHHPTWSNLRHLRSSPCQWDSAQSAQLTPLRSKGALQRRLVSRSLREPSPPPLQAARGWEDGVDGTLRVHEEEAALAASRSPVRIRVRLARIQRKQAAKDALGEELWLVRRGEQQSGVYSHGGAPFFRHPGHLDERLRRQLRVFEDAAEEVGIVEDGRLRRKVGFAALLHADQRHSRRSASEQAGRGRFLALQRTPHPSSPASKSSTSTSSAAACSSSVGSWPNSSFSLSWMS